MSRPIGVGDRSTGPYGSLGDFLQVTDTYIIFSDYSVVKSFIQDLIKFSVDEVIKHGHYVQYVQ